MSQPTNSGFITIHRAIAAWPLYRYLRADQKHVITTLLLLANWKPSVVWITGRRFEVGRGELIHTETKIAEEAGCSRKVVRTVLDLLLKDGFISEHKVATAGARSVRKITIRNYDRFQSLEDRAGPGAVHQEDIDGTWTGHAGAPSEPSKPEEPKRSRAKARVSEPGRFEAVRDKLVAVFAETKRVKYGFQGPKDATAVKRLLDLGDDPEIERRWRIALGVAGGYHACNSIAVFASRWNDYHAPPISNLNGTKKQLATIPPSPPEVFGKAGEVTKVEF